MPTRARARWLRLTQPAGDLSHGPFASRLREEAAGVDVVHIVGPYAASLMPLVSPPTLVQFDCATRLDRDVGAPWTRGGRIAIELLRAERRACRRARWVLASSAEVATELSRTAPRARVLTAPLALDPQYYTPPARLEDPIAGLIGTARWPPTADAVTHLLRAVWPRVLAQRPDARLLLAGRGMVDDAFPDLPKLPGVQWLGDVPSATEFLRRLGVLLYPLGRGSGAKVKVLEALALGLPVVTTPRGAEGLMARDGLAVETDADALADRCAALLRDRQARRERGEAGRSVFIEHHTPVPAAEPVVSLYEEMVGRRVGATAHG